MAVTMGPSRLLRRVFLDPLLSAIRDSSMVRTMYSCGGERQRLKYKKVETSLLPAATWVKNEACVEV